MLTTLTIIAVLIQQGNTYDCKDPPEHNPDNASVTVHIGQQGSYTVPDLYANN